MFIDKMIVIALTLLIYVPGTSLGSYMRLGVLAVSCILIFLMRGSFIDRKIANIAICMVFGPFIPMLFVFLIEGHISTGLVFHELIRMIYCALLLVTVTRIEVGYRTVYFCALLAFIPNFIIQLLQYMKFQPIFTLIRRYYVTETEGFTHLELATYSGAAFRSGSIFLNPNVYMAIPMVAMCIFLYRDRVKPSLLNSIFIICTVVSGFLTGSRTSMVVMIIVLAVYYFRYADASRRVVFLAVFLFAALRYGSFLMENSRAVNLSDTGSLEVKINSYFWYMRRTMAMPLYWLTGSMGSSLTGSMDAEWGYIYAWYGIFGLVWYIKYYCWIWRNNANIDFFSKVITIVCALVSFTASVMLCMPIYSFVGTIALVQMRENRLVVRT